MRQTVKVNGRTLREALSDLFNSQEYQQGVYGSANLSKTSRGERSKPYMIAQVFTTYNKAIKSELAQESPIARRWMTAANAKRKDTAYLRGVSASELVADPSMYRANGLREETYDVAGQSTTTTSSLLKALGG